MRKSLFSFIILGAVGCTCIGAATGRTLPNGQAQHAAPTIDAGCAGEVSCDIVPPQVSTSHKAIHGQAETVGPCPADMVLVEGMYCTKAEHRCKRYIAKDIGNPSARCEEFYPAKCLNEKAYKRFCIAKYEYTNPGEELPLTGINWNEAAAICKANGNRLCMESEWQFACGGPNNLAYPTGNVRPSDVCNIDIEHNLGKPGHLIDHRKPPAALDKCVSVFGVVSMTGNVDEFTKRDITVGPYKTSMSGGWHGPLRNNCFASTVAHNEIYSDQNSAGFRCCKDTQ